MDPPKGPFNLLSYSCTLHGDHTHSKNDNWNVKALKNEFGINETQ